MSQQDHTDELARFPIRELSARTKVNTVTIRAWERRYGLLNPERTSKGHRLYSDNDVVTIEKILALVARGVPLGKVKALLTDESLEESYDTADTWAEPVVKLVDAVKAFSSSRIEHLIDQYFLNYPPSICREQLIEPMLEALAQVDDKNATYLFAESELVRYAVLRLNTKVANSARPVMMLFCGDNTPLWRLALMAMELADAGFKVQLVTRPFTIDACAEIAINSQNSVSVFYQDGQWRKHEADKVTRLLNINDNLMLVGTAPVLAGIEEKNRVFNDLGQCVRALIDALQPDEKNTTINKIKEGP
ncbi:MerR family transcriptional regulator [Alkalimarinus sediminis]|uniref:MerR family transcriptional regulator n=1 Tax=Alkalimarinus sediminis TaxID=1632866 RepID=A0A9E8HKC5_9ALTE|nr:MerR family transcriptional regulator [Alkalimarinus sediminis]UZW74283.1 MerR family transcriptional regulator [Alkalimarinus sediminis]